ncbi:prolyl oligopeptidase family serine peptidase, partial [Sphingomonas bacterium]|uniref:prolyl oligopeptidase family serine peptidase n=1 Tax=Sphingomonas bacterium TaxID=1895847 RepID=UPI0015757572
AALPGGDVLASVSTYVEPTRFVRWAGARGAATPTALAVTSPISFADCTVTRAVATSKDGTRVPYTVIARRGTQLDGRNPTLLYGYGGYGISMTPTFLGAMRRVWLEAGGVYVIANLRGGGEYGDGWHRDGMLEHKQNVFDDFTAVADALVARGFTSHARLAVMGGSNGGLLMGATLTQHPALARAVVSAVGLYDMVRSEQDPNGAFNVTEYGSVTDPAQLRAIYAYSPYHHVVPGTAYPAVLMLTGANDGRVNPLQSRKFAAALQAAQGAADRPILLRTSQTSGHGIGSSVDDRIAEQTDQLMFLFDQLGVAPAR